MAAKVAAGAQPWIGSWNILIANSHAQLTYTPHPVATLIRGTTSEGPQNYNRAYNDAAAAYQLALRWKGTGDTRYADKAVQVLNAWGSTLTRITGDSNQVLAAGLYGYQFANAGEIMRSYSGWAAADFARFQNMMSSVFYPISHGFLSRPNDTHISHYWANWDLCSMASVMAIGILCDNQSYYDEAINYFENGPGNGGIENSVYYTFPGNLGQWQESGRDNGHATLVVLEGVICQMAWNQGDDLYGYDNNRVLAGAEYVAKYNLGYDVPYVPYNNVDHVNQNVLAAGTGGRIGFELIFDHYQNVMGVAAPYSGAVAAANSPDGGGGNYGPNSGGYDELGFYNLTNTLDPIAPGQKPSGLTALEKGTGNIELDWWGAAYATSYNVYRASNPDGPFSWIASNITDPLTYTDTPPESGTYYYAVTAISPSGESDPSNVQSATSGVMLQTQLLFHDGAGTTAADSSGNGNDGTLVNGANWTTDAVSLNGAGSYVSLPPNLLSRTWDFTIDTWVHLNRAAVNSRIFDFGTDTNRWMFLTATNRNGRDQFATGIVEGNNEQAVVGTALPINQWVNVAVTLSNRVATLYVNGVAVGSNPNMDFSPFEIDAMANDWIGRSQWPADPYLNGQVSDFRIYCGALSACDISALSTTPPGGGGLAPSGGGGKAPPGDGGMAMSALVQSIIPPPTGEPSSRTANSGPAFSTPPLVLSGIPAPVLPPPPVLPLNLPAAPNGLTATAVPAQPLANDTWTMTNLVSSRLVDNPDGSRFSGTRMIQITVTGDASQQWTFTDDDNGFV